MNFQFQITNILLDDSLEGVEIAAREGWKQLMQGASAVTAVQAAVNSLEDNPVFDAGKP